MRGTDTFNISNIHYWNRRYLTFFWCTVVLAIVIQELGLLLTGADLHTQTTVVLRPAAVNLALLGVAEFIFRRMPRWFHVTILVVSNGICSVVIAVYHTIDYIQALWMLPILISCFYFKRLMVIYSAVQSVATFLIMTVLHPGLRERTDLSEWLAMPAFLLLTSLIALSAMERAIELLRSLRIESEDKQHLMIQNVIKDKLVRTDALTGLYNRAALNEHLDMLLRYADSEGFSIHVAMLDVDHFKSVNDTYGHQTGDVVLKRIAAVIREEVNSSDFAARYGGEEFMIVFTDRTLNEVKQVLERVRIGVDEAQHQELAGRRVTVSIGLSPYAKGMEREKLIEHADACLYEAKRTGRNRLCDHANAS